MPRQQVEVNAELPVVGRIDRGNARLRSGEPLERVRVRVEIDVLEGMSGAVALCDALAHELRRPREGLHERSVHARLKERRPLARLSVDLFEGREVQEGLAGCTVEDDQCARVSLQTRHGQGVNLVRSQCTLAQA